MVDEKENELFNLSDSNLPPIVKIVNITKRKRFLVPPKGSIHTISVLKKPSFDQPQELHLSEDQLKDKLKNGWKHHSAKVREYKARLSYVKELRPGYWEMIEITALGGFSFLEAILSRYKGWEGEEKLKNVKEQDADKIMKKYGLEWISRSFFEYEGILHEHYENEEGTIELDVAFENPEYAQMQKIKGDLTPLGNF